MSKNFFHIFNKDRYYLRIIAYFCRLIRIHTMAVLQQNFATKVKEYVLITFGLFLYVGAWSLFLVPNNFVGGGISGICSIIYYATHGVVGIGTMYFIFNTILLLIAKKVLGSAFSWKTVYAVVFASVMFDILPPLVPQEFINAFVLPNGKMLSAILGGALVGMSVGVTMSQGGSTGGTDVVALMINKKFNISPGKIILTLDILIISSAMVVPSYTSTGEALSLANKIAVAAYGFMMVTVSGYCVDLYLSGSKQSVQVLIFSKKHQELADAIVYDFKRGVTILHAQGWYTKQDREVVCVVTRKTDLPMLMRYIKAIDPQAFMSVSTVMGVFGEGFDVIKDEPGFLTRKSAKNRSVKDENESV